VIIGAALILALVFYQYRKQAVLDRSWRWIRREDAPSDFWTIIIGQIFMAVVVAAFGIHDMLRQ